MLLNSPQNISDVFIPISVISQEQIRNSGNVRLHKIFIEQISLTINFDHGASIQIQNLNSEYIPILVDDDPLNGRTAWTLDFSRITINNIERIEVVKGLSSSLYGSEAIGGFINIITKTPASDLYLNVDAKYRSFNTSDIDTSLNYTKENFNIQAFYNRLNSDGYNLNQETLSQTAAPFATTTIQLKSVFDISEKMKFSASTTYYEEPQEDFTIVSVHNRVTSTDDSDIGIKGTTIHTDGGINGTGGVQATTISAVFDNLMSVPYGTTFNYEAIAINKKRFWIQLISIRSITE